MTQHPPTTTNDMLVLSGLTELATGALTGWPYALAINDADKARKLGVRSVPRLRQWHLDLIALGSLSVLIGTAVPDLLTGTETAHQRPTNRPRRKPPARRGRASSIPRSLRQVP